MSRSRLRSLNNKLKRVTTPSLKKISNELKAGTEFGRAIPGPEQSQIRTNVAIGVTEGEPAIPAAQGRTEISTYFTKDSGDHLLYQAEGWVKLRLMLITAGPVDIGTRDQVSPVGSGKGIPLPQDVEVVFPLVKGNRIFITAVAVNRVRFIIEPIPWAEQITTMLGSMLSIMRGK